MRKDFYTYAYLREDGTPYYIGKGCGKRAYKKNNRRGCSRPKEISRIIFLKKNLTEEEAYRHEVYMIFVLGRKDIGTGILRNLTDGGEKTPSTKNTIWTTSGEEERQRPIGEPLPAGWRYGRKPDVVEAMVSRTRTQMVGKLTKEMKWWKNETTGEQGRFREGEEPSGWMRGRLPYHHRKGR